MYSPWAVPTLWPLPAATQFRHTAWSTGSARTWVLAEPLPPPVPEASRSPLAFAHGNSERRWSQATVYSASPKSATTRSRPPPGLRRKNESWPARRGPVRRARSPRPEAWSPHGSGNLTLGQRLLTPHLGEFVSADLRGQPVHRCLLFLRRSHRQPGGLAPLACPSPSRPAPRTTPQPPRQDHFPMSQCNGVRPTERGGRQAGQRRLHWPRRGFS